MYERNKFETILLYLKLNIGLLANISTCFYISNMIKIPTNLYEEHLSMWIHEQLNKSKGTEEECIFSFLMRLSRCQMTDRQRGEMFPYIINFNPSEKEISITRILYLCRDATIAVRKAYYIFFISKELGNMG